MTREQKKEWVIRVGIGVGVAAITTLIVRKNFVSHLDSGVNELAPRAATSTFSFNFLSRSGDIVTTVHNGTRGHPGFRVRNLDFGIEFDTQGQAARAFGIPQNVVSKHLNGHLPDAYGKHFERIAPS